MNASYRYYDSVCESRRLDAEDEKEFAMEWIANRVRTLQADDDIVLEAMADSLADRRTRYKIAKSMRAGDLLQAVTVMHKYIPTYIAERADLDYEDAKQRGRL
ncbi:hypothetical protein [Luteibacter sp. SG786]|uniref:hypothetical protein n=1 Tax=Luteibacter sp. SG786 TaxID=2587130 RepID=UPI0014242DF6|nr:hypothetical protein [Luteibacter sp. SG786]NII54366.1 hypothetical protein [Luteibacter sp. SG786]